MTDKFSFYIKLFAVIPVTFDLVDPNGILTVGIFDSDGNSIS